MFTAKIDCETTLNHAHKKLKLYAQRSEVHCIVKMMQTNSNKSNFGSVQKSRHHLRGEEVWKI